MEGGLIHSPMPFREALSGDKTISPSHQYGHSRLLASMSCNSSRRPKPDGNGVRFWKSNGGKLDFTGGEDSWR